MSLPVHLVPDLAGTAVGDTVRVEGDEAHHAVAVRRLRVGERLVLTDGSGYAATGEVVSTGKRLLTVRIEEVRAEEPPHPALTVVQALPKGERGELAVEMLTEIGAARIVPWAAARSVAVWKGERAARSLARWRATAREAAKQARRSWFPEVTELADTAEVAALLGESTGAAGPGIAVVLHEDGAGRLADLRWTDSRAGTSTDFSADSRADTSVGGQIVLVVGPEGGLTDEEIAAFETAGATTVRLGGEVLRTSTAGVAAAAALLATTPRWA
ncbi:MAG: 16S rRNA (uracil(1498)-N(3))-methyltransferase [Nocardioides sp.]|uniref:16S rRNA (uracil(1498)-N(3))-methyltransferase n=1 Tax=Nocardioides sp. TaxID=35761 RepID=UPI0039E48FA3